MPPNTRLQVVAALETGGGLTIVQFKELPPLDPILLFTEAGTRPSVAGEGEVLLVIYYMSESCPRDIIQ